MYGGYEDDGGDDDGYFEIEELRAPPHININFEIDMSVININIIDHDLEFVDIPFPGFQPPSKPAALSISSYDDDDDDDDVDVDVDVADDHNELNVDPATDLNSRWGPWGLVETTNNRKVQASSVKRMNRSRMVKVRVIHIISISASIMMRPLERWLAHLIASRSRSRSKKSLSPPLLIHHQSIPLPTTGGGGGGRGGGDPSISLLHAAIAHCNHSYIPPLLHHLS